MKDTKTFNPFRPNSPVPPGMFTGRIHELDRIDDSYLKLGQGNPSHLMIVGERGIGKSSLLLFCDMLAKGDVVWQADIKYQYLPIHFSIEKDLTKLDIIRKLKGGLERHLRKEEKIFELFQKSCEFLQKFEVGNFKMHADNLVDYSIIDKFVYSFADACESLRNNVFNRSGVVKKRYGIVILIDEVDNSSVDLGLGAFIKNFTEGLQIQGCNNVMFIISGLPNIRDILRESHESSLRLFEELELLPIENKDTEELYQRGIKTVNSKSGKFYRYAPDALSRMIGASEGYPHFIQQIGASTFDINENEVINLDTVNRAIFDTHGAIDLIGDRYYRTLYYDSIKEDAYREILKIMAENLSKVTTRKQLLEKFKGSKNTLDNGLSALRNRGIILPVIGKRGEYRLQWVGFGLWIKFFTHCRNQ